MFEASKPSWVELSSTDPAASRAFYSKLFGWRIEVDPDPQYGGCALAKHGSIDIGGVGPKMQGDPSPTHWSIYFGTTDVDATAKKAAAAGGSVVVQPMDVPGQGRFAVLRDPSGAFVSAWQATAMRGFHSGDENEFGWAELSARGLEKDILFYQAVFGWTAKKSGGDGAPPYSEFQVNGESIAGAMEMAPQVPAQVPSYWMPYFNVADVDAATKKAKDAGAREMVPPQDFPGGRFSVVADPQGASFGLLKTKPR